MLHSNLDSGVQCNVLPASTYWIIQPVAPLQPTKMVLSGIVSDMKMKPTWIVTLPIISPVSSGVTQEIFFITEEAELPFLGMCASEAMGLFNQVHNIQSCVTLLANLECVRNIRKISRALLVRSTLWHSMMRRWHLSLSRYTGCQSRRVLSLKMSRWSHMVWLNGLATSWFIGDKKNGTLRICLDPKPLNPVIKHE